MFEVLYQDQFCVVIDKPEGFHVHNPEWKDVKVPKEKIIMPQLRDQLGQWVYPVHRLDAATSGCLIWALSSEAAAYFSLKLQEGHFKKIYHAVARGWAGDEFEIKISLKSENDPEKFLEAHTIGHTMARIEHDVSVGNRHPKARYSLLKLQAVSGRFHQLRRHLNHISHPIVGDVAHGDRFHNRYFREELNIKGLCLRAQSLEFPSHGNPEKRILVDAPETPKWSQVKQLFQ